MGLTSLLGNRILTGLLLTVTFQFASAMEDIRNRKAANKPYTNMIQMQLTKFNTQHLIQYYHAVKTNLIHYAYRKTFVFNPRKHRWYAYGGNGRVIKSGRASGGANYCRDVKRACRTPSGSFQVIRKGGPGCKSSKYPLGRGGAPMGYCMFFSKYYAIHASNSVPGRNASHGCVRVTPSAARWLSRNFIRIGTRVVVLPY
jgi:lipoprotein-anchoring transpeptidase ErfK/SrfK